MKVRNFEEWFAIRINHDDEKHWSGRIIFNLERGIRLETVRFMGAEAEGDSRTLNMETITGWLDYQQPATLVRPKIVKAGGFSFGMNTPAMREAYELVVDAVLKNIFVENLSEAIFTGVSVEHPSIHAWINPTLLTFEDAKTQNDGDTLFSVHVHPENKRIFNLTNGTILEVASYVRASKGNKFGIQQYSSITLKFSESANYEKINRVIWRISCLFDFLSGEWAEPPVYRLPTSQQRQWNGENREVVAELWYRPARRADAERTDSMSSMFVEEESSISIKDIFDFALGDNDQIIHLASVIQDVEQRNGSIVQRYGDLLGCLENFDKRQFGSGSDQNFSQTTDSMLNLVTENGSPEQIAMMKRMRGALPNNFSLLKRLQRLHSFWEKDCFRCSPDLERIKSLRNMAPHGRGLEISLDVAQEMSVYLSYLAALGRYHILRAMGFKTDEIINSFMRKPYRYGMFVPDHAFDR